VADGEATGAGGEATGSDGEATGADGEATGADGEATGAGDEATGAGDEATGAGLEASASPGISETMVTGALAALPAEPDASRVCTSPNRTRERNLVSPPRRPSMATLKAPPGPAVVSPTTRLRPASISRETTTLSPAANPDPHTSNGSSRVRVASVAIIRACG
jgi:hypothetical protein